MSSYLPCENILLAEWAILCLDGSFLKAPLNLLKRTEGGAGPSADLRLCGSGLRGTVSGRITDMMADGPTHGAPVQTAPPFCLMDWCSVFKWSVLDLFSPRQLQFLWSLLVP